MGRTEIDLTKCNNLRAKVVGKVCGRKEEFTEVGRIVVDEVEGVLLDNDKGGYVDLFYDGKQVEDVISIEILPRDPETYKDWQVGDKVVQTVYHETESGDDGEFYCFAEVIFRSGQLVVLGGFEDADECAFPNKTCNQLFNEDYRLVLTDIEKQVIEEKKKAEWEPQDGDIVAWGKGESGGFAISIYNENRYTYVTLYTNGECDSRPYRKNMEIIRPATEEEKQRLFDAMAKKGKRWNAEKKVVEDIPKPYEFKAKDVVMVRDDTERWKLMVFVAMGGGAYKYKVTNGEKFIAYKQCIPYNEKTMHLLGTKEDYEEEVQ